MGRGRKGTTSSGKSERGDCPNETPASRAALLNDLLLVPDGEHSSPSGGGLLLLLLASVDLARSPSDLDDVGSREVGLGAHAAEQRVGTVVEGKGVVELDDLAGFHAGQKEGRKKSALKRAEEGHEGDVHQNPVVESDGVQSVGDAEKGLGGEPVEEEEERRGQSRVGFGGWIGRDSLDLDGGLDGRVSLDVDGTGGLVLKESKRKEGISESEGEKKTRRKTEPEH